MGPCRVTAGHPCSNWRVKVKKKKNSKVTEQVLNLMYFKMATEWHFFLSHRPVTVSGNKMKSWSDCETRAFRVHFAALSFHFLLQMTFTALFTPKSFALHESSSLFSSCSAITHIHNLHCRFYKIILSSFQWVLGFWLILSCTLYIYQQNIVVTSSTYSFPLPTLVAMETLGSAEPTKSREIIFNYVFFIFSFTQENNFCAQDTCIHIFVVFSLALSTCAIVTGAHCL